MSVDRRRSPPLCAPLLLAALALACGPAPRPAPPRPPLDLARHLPADAPLTAVARPAALRDALAAHGLAPALPALPDDAAFTGLGLDPARPVWIALRAGPVLGVLRAAEDAGRVIADGAADPIIDPRLSPIDPFTRWLDAHPPPPAWVHLRLVGLPAPAPDPAPDRAAAIGARHGALAVAHPADPPETLAATLDAPPDAARALAAAFPGARPTVYRLLDAALPVALLVHRPPPREGEPRPVIVDALFDLDLGPGGLAAAVAALPEARPADAPAPPAARGRVFGEPGQDELLRVGLDHAGWQAAARMVGEVAALQSVIGQGPLTDEAAATLDAGRRRAAEPVALLAPVDGTITGSALTVVRVDAGLRLRLALPTATAALAGLRDGRAPADQGQLAAALAPGDTALSLAQPPAAVGRVLAPAFGAPDRPLPALLAAVERCGAPCLPALYSAPLAHARDLPATIAALTGHAPLAPALADATGAAALWRRGAFAAAVGHRPPATLDRAAWAPILDGAGLESRWIVGEQAILVAGRGPALPAMAEAARAPAVTDAAAARFTAVRDLGAGPVRIDGALSFDRDGVALDAVIDRPPPSPPPG